MGRAKQRSRSTCPVSDDSRRRSGQSSLAEQLGSVNGAATQLGTTWPSLRKAFTRHGLGMPTPNPEAVRQRAIAAARQRSGQPVAPPPDPVFVALNPHALPARPRTPAELHQWVRRDEEYATLGANVVVEQRKDQRPLTDRQHGWRMIQADRWRVWVDPAVGMPGLPTRGTGGGARCPQHR
jgi:hypothetical protein